MRLHINVREKARRESKISHGVWPDAINSIRSQAREAAKTAASDDRLLELIGLSTLRPVNVDLMNTISGVGGEVVGGSNSEQHG